MAPPTGVSFPLREAPVFRKGKPMRNEPGGEGWIVLPGTEHSQNMRHVSFVASEGIILIAGW